MVVAQLGDLVLQLRHPRRSPNALAVVRSSVLIRSPSLSHPIVPAIWPSAPSPQSPPSFACWPPSSSAPTPRAQALVSLVSPSIYLLSNCANPTAIATNTPPRPHPHPPRRINPLEPRAHHPPPSPFIIISIMPHPTTCAPVLVKHKVVVTVELFVACLARFLNLLCARTLTLPASNGK